MIAGSSAGESKRTELGAVVPAFNEEQGIAAFLELLFGVLRSGCTRFEEWVTDVGARARVEAYVVKWQLVSSRTFANSNLVSGRPQEYGLWSWYGTVIHN
jgi:hypothetical protein